MPDPRTAPLRSLLLAYQPCNDLEGGYLDSMLARLDLPADSFSRNSFHSGHFTASGFVVSPDRLSLLLVHHAKLRKWLQPGGHVEPDDVDLESAARREIAEETGLGELEARGLVDLDIHRFPKGDGGPAHDHLDVRFGFLAGLWQVRAGDGTAEVGWFRLDEVAAWIDRPSLSRPARKLVRSL